MIENLKKNRHLSPPFLFSAYITFRSTHPIQLKRLFIRHSSEWSQDKTEQANNMTNEDNKSFKIQKKA